MMTSKLQQDKSCDYVVTLNAGIALTAVQAAKDAGSPAKIGTFDTSKEMAKAVKDGTVQFAVDQQPYLQGYLAIDAIWLYKTNGNTIGGGEATLTGPAFIDKSQHRRRREVRRGRDALRHSMASTITSPATADDRISHAVDRCPPAEPSRDRVARRRGGHPGVLRDHGAAVPGHQQHGHDPVPGRADRCDGRAGVAADDRR